MISTNLVQEKRLLSNIKNILVNSIVHLDTKFSVLSHTIQEAGVARERVLLNRNTKPVHLGVRWVWSDELGYFLAEGVFPPSILQPRKAQPSTLWRGVYKTDQGRKLPSFSKLMWTPDQAFPLPLVISKNCPILSLKITQLHMLFYRIYVLHTMLCCLYHTIILILLLSKSEFNHICQVSKH